MTTSAKEVVPAEIMAQHVAVLGKTGSGKTSTAKVLIEQVVREGARVCVLDPIKSDWWGLTSSADGKRAGMPFHILGGPRGHVGLHASAGKAIAEIVANGALPLSILDMADFEPGGQAKFFVDFAPTLLRKMRGVVYLVVEEAHLFAPKERSGVGAENLSIHWAKMLATAGRSKGIRLVVLSQRVQALHNAVLGSCDTLIAHRLTAPADQKPIVDWLKANASTDVMLRVSESLSSLKTGHGWICAGEAKLFEQRQFPRISTYDNTATPTGELGAREVKTAAVDQEKLRAIIGDAVEQAKADDPRELKKQLADARRQVEQLQRKTAAGSLPAREKVTADVREKLVEKKVIGPKEAARLEGAVTNLERLRTVFADLIERADGIGQKARDVLADIQKTAADVRQLLAPAPAHTSPASAHRTAPSTHKVADRVHIMHAERQPPARRASRSPSVDGAADDVSLGAMHRAILTALAQHPDGLTKRQVRAYTDYAEGGALSRAYALVHRLGLVVTENGKLLITDLGLTTLGPFEPLPKGAALREHVLDGTKINSMEKALLRLLFDAYPNDVAKNDLREQTGYAEGGALSRAYAHLVSIDYAVKVGKGRLKAAEPFFDE